MHGQLWKMETWGYVFTQTSYKTMCDASQAGWSRWVGWKFLTRDSSGASYWCQTTDHETTRHLAIAVSWKSRQSVPVEEINDNQGLLQIYSEYLHFHQCDKVFTSIGLIFTFASYEIRGGGHIILACSIKKSISQLKIWSFSSLGNWDKGYACVASNCAVWAASHLEAGLKVGLPIRKCANKKLILKQGSHVRSRIIDNQHSLKLRDGLSRL